MINAFPYMVLALMQIYNRDMAMVSGTGDDMQYAVDLNAMESMYNAENFGYYAGGQSR